MDIRFKLYKLVDIKTNFETCKKVTPCNGIILTVRICYKGCQETRKVASEIII